MKENINLCEQIIKVIPKSLDEVYRTSEKLEDIGINAKFLNRMSIYPHTYYYYVINNKYILYLYFRNGELLFMKIYTERPQRTTICELDLEQP